MKPFDLTRFKKNTEKALGIKSGFFDPKTFIDTGSYALNYRISGDFFKGVPLDGKVTVFAGESGSGKSYIVSGNMVRWCQQNGVLVCLFDTEDAVGKQWANNLGVNTDDGQTIIRLPVSSPNDVATSLNAFMEQYRETYAGVPDDEVQKVLFVIDSLGMLTTETQKEQFKAGDMKGDMGIKAKQLKALVSQCIRLFNGWPVGMVATNHTYASQNPYSPDDIISGGSGFVFASSLIIGMQKFKMKEDEDGNKISDVRGIRSKIKVIKSRYAKPFTEVELRIPYDTGLSPYTGLVSMFESAGILVKSGNRLEYVDPNGEIFKFYRKEWNNNHELLHKLMNEYSAETIKVGVGDDLDAFGEDDNI